jgi:hypothetical protein
MMQLFDVVSHRLEQHNGVRRWYIEGAADSKQAGCWQEAVERRTKIRYGVAR